MMTLVVVLAELTLALLLILGILAWKFALRRAQEREAVNHLVASISTSRPERTQKLTDRLRSCGQLSDDDALGKANELIKKQNRFYQDTIDLYYHRNHELLSSLDGRLEDLLEQYSTIVITKPGDEAAMIATNEAIEKLSRDVAAMTKNIEELRTENEMLHRQLNAAEKELDQLGREYVSAFNINKNKTGAGGPESDEVPQAEPAAPSDMDVAQQETESPALVADEATAQQSNSARLEQERGLLADLDLTELIGKDAGPGTEGVPSKA